MKQSSRSLVHEFSLLVGALLLLLTSSATAGPSPIIKKMFGNITGTVNGIAVNFDVEITLNFATGEEFAEIRNMPPSLGAVLRPVTAMVTIGGPTGGLPQPPLTENLHSLSGGTFSNVADVFWPDLPDTITLVHNVTNVGVNTMNFTATMNGTAPIISINDAVEFADFSEVLLPGPPPPAPASGEVSGQGGAAQTIISGPGGRPYDVGGTPFPPCPPTCPGGGGTGKGSTTTYTGNPLPFPVLRSVSNLTTTYDAGTETMTVQLVNILPEPGLGLSLAFGCATLGALARRRRTGARKH